jgi:hypothetical protein
MAAAANPLAIFRRSSGECVADSMDKGFPLQSRLSRFAAIRGKRRANHYKRGLEVFHRARFPRKPDTANPLWRTRARHRRSSGWPTHERPGDCWCKAPAGWDNDRVNIVANDQYAANHWRGLQGRGALRGAACPGNATKTIGAMKTYIVSVPSQRVAEAYADWKLLAEECERTIMDDGWTLPSLRFHHLYKANAAALDLAMVSGSIAPLQPHEVLITEIDSSSLGSLS